MKGDTSGWRHQFKQKFLSLSDGLLEKPTVVGCIVGVLVFIGVVGARNLGWLERLELSAYDRLVRMCMSAPVSQPHVALVTIGESDIQSMGHWPPTDAELTDILRTVTKNGAVAVGVDIYRDVPVPPGQEELNTFLAQNPQVVFPMKCRSVGGIGVQPPAVLKDTDQVGFVDMVVDRDGTVRRGLLFLDDGQNSYLSMSLRLALRFLEPHGVVPQPDSKYPEYLRLGPSVIHPLQPDTGGYSHADAGGYQFLLDFRCKSEFFPIVSLADLMSGKVDLNVFRGNVVLVGVAAESINDFFYIPLRHFKKFEQLIPGVALHAFSAQQLIEIGLGDHAPIGAMISWQYILWIFVWALTGGVMGGRLHTIWRVGWVGIVGIFMMAVAANMALYREIWVPSASSALAWLGALGGGNIWMLTIEKQRRRQLMRLFAKHVSPEFADVIWQQRNQFLQHGRILPQKLTATVLFLDIVGFTMISEKLPPDKLITWLNEMMDVMVQAVIEHHGVVNKFIGDSIMAVFGVPVPRLLPEEIRQDAIHAVACALAMRDRLILLNRQWQAADLPLVLLRIGIFTGDMVAGSLGAVDRMEYAVIGDTVNVASRLESFDKENVKADPLTDPCRICVGDSTMKLTYEKFEMAPMKPVVLKGKQIPMSVYRVIGKKEVKGRNL
jgi:adenylate cyclase